MATDQENQETDTPNSSLLDIPEADIDIIPHESMASVLPNTTEASRKLKASIRAKIEETDPDLAKVWDYLNELNDANEILRQNFMEAQVFIREAQLEFYANKRRDTKDLANLMEKLGEEGYEQWRKVYQDYAREWQKSRNDITRLWKVAKQIAQEYRQCAMQKRYTLHIALVQAWKMAMESAVYRHVSDETTRRKIAEDVREAGRALCPVAADSDV